MLNWLRHIAKHPLEPSIKPIPETSKWKEYKGNDFWVQILKARNFLLLRQCVESTSLEKLKMHPAMYEDHVAFSPNSTVKLRCSQRHTTC
ncbi:hypothetical protein L6164_019445 [Bauhinia variegata]|uniref:Uncharacterized protein n=1 Tax=Bauhinia variegata TaxID=167791 RepID=A0ACB9MS53_BAUVA|nr:hypothetical protein L6164_019445 [Bauhinia variegata]